jgi:nucleoside-diphosphate-sugar epimerase
VVNIGSNREISIIELSALIQRLMGMEVNLMSDEQRLRPAASEVKRLWCDNAKIHRFTGFEPVYTLESGLRETIDWFLNPHNLSKYKTAIYNV